MGLLEDILKDIAFLVTQVKELRREFAQLADKIPEPARNWSYAQVAEEVGVAKGTVRSWVSRGKVETVVVDGVRLIPDQAVRRLLARGGRPGKRVE